jgi:predicted dehydrogenase
MNVALIGYGYAGKTLHAPLIECTDGLHLSAIVSSDAGKVHRDRPDVAVAASADEVFANPAIDLVVIATPNGTHFDLARRAIGAGKHVVVDKPFTTNYVDAKELAKVARDSGRLLSIFHNRRWDGDFLTVRELIATGELGDVVHFESHYDRFRPTVMHRWREQGGPGSGIWFDLGAHLVDQALQLFGIPEAVYGDLAMQRDQAVAIDYFHVLLRYGRTRVVLHGSNLVADPPRRFEVHGTAGSFVKCGMDSQEDALKRGDRPGGPGWGADVEDGTLTVWKTGVSEGRKVATVHGDYLAFYVAVRDAIAKGGPNPVPPEDAAVVIGILELAAQSAASGKELCCDAFKAGRD